MATYRDMVSEVGLNHTHKCDLHHQHSADLRRSGNLSIGLRVPTTPSQMVALKMQ